MIVFAVQVQAFMQKPKDFLNDLLFERIEKSGRNFLCHTH